MNNNHLAYLNDNYLQIKIKDKITKIITPSIACGQIINHQQFIIDFQNNLHIKNYLATNITITINEEITEAIQDYYKNIFEELNYIKINLISVKKKMENNTSIVNHNYYIILHDNVLYQIYDFLLDTYLLFFHINKLKIISTNKLKNNDNCKYFYYSNSDNYFFT